MALAIGFCDMAYGQLSEPSFEGGDLPAHLGLPSQFVKRTILSLESDLPDPKTRLAPLLLESTSQPSELYDPSSTTSRSMDSKSIDASIDTSRVESSSPRQSPSTQSRPAS